MEEIQYIGEHLAPGQFGRFAITLGFVASILAAVAYFFATQRRHQSDFEGWRKIGRFSFSLHAACVFIVIGAIFFVMINKYYEYQYVWAHVSEELQFKYIFSAFWEGQEGSFLLWMFWHVILGMIILFRGGKWETSVLTPLALIQAFIFSMILGVYITDETKIGSNPLLLLREIPDWMELPVFNNPEYVSLIQGNGLNPLLQNYWMTIHPPTLFLGFASTSIPFCYAVAALWTKRHSEWLKAVMPWALFSASILGTGILMGGVWAYEALTFGGYWAWDPVENMSLVPWIVLVAGIHTNLIARKTNYSIKSTYLFYILTFILILYSTFLTRSGVLGESSVHAFTEMGLEWQLIGFIAFFSLMGFGLFGMRNKEIPIKEAEESTPSKEFWMFIGALVLIFSAAMISASTSLPVFNKIRQFFDPEFKGFTIEDPVEHYNKYQLWIAVFVALLSGGAQFLRFKENSWQSHSRKVYKHIGISAGIALGFTILASLWINVFAWQYWLLLFASMFGVVANVDYLISFLKGNLKVGASTIAHIGFGLMIIGAMASGLNKQHISTNPVAQAGLLDEEMLEKNVMLFKERPIFMSGYEVEYQKDTMIGKERYYTINYKKLSDGGKVTEEFAVHPSALFDNKGVKVAAYNPSTKHYLHKDIFTHILTIPLREADIMEARKFEDTLTYSSYDLSIGKPTLILDTLKTRFGPTKISTEVKLLGITQNPQHPDYEPKNGDLAMGVQLSLKKDDSTYLANPAVIIRDQLLYTYPVQLDDLSMKVRLNDAAIDKILSFEQDLNYVTHKVKKDEVFEFEGYKISFSGVAPQPNNPRYVQREGDTSVGGIILVEDENGTTYEAQPVFTIRGKAPMNFKDEIEEIGLHLRFIFVDPTTETFEIAIAKHEELPVVPVEISKRSFRTDYIILETIVFPGINLVWLGSIMMMLGLGVGMWNRRKQNAALAA